MKVSIGANKGWLRLRWTLQGKPDGFYLGMKDNPTGRAVARQKASQMEADFHSGNFDPTLLKYKPQTLGKNATQVNAPELFRKFTQAMEKDKALSVGALCKYRGVQAHLEKRLNVSAQSVGDRAAGDFAANLLELVSNDTAKQYLWLLQSCWHWAAGKFHLAEQNPWPAQVARVKPQPKQKKAPFTEAEVKAILSGFQSDRYYRHYYPMVVMLFGTGCRFGEAVGLQWQHVAADFQTVWIGESVTREGKRKSTKTGKARTVLLSASVANMLRELHQARQPKPEDLVFPAPKGGPVNDKLFNRRAFRAVLERASVPYRRAYTTRHTAISHALANGADPVGIADQTGHDLRTLLKVYAHVIKSQPVFVEFWNP